MINTLALATIFTLALLVPILGYVLILRRMADAAQPYRLKMATLGERLLAANPSAGRAGQIHFFLNNAFNGRVAPVAAVLLPFAALWIIAKVVFHSLTRTGPKLGVNRNADDIRMGGLFLLSAFAANPCFGAILLLEMLVFGTLLLVVSGADAITEAGAAVIRAEAYFERLLSNARPTAFSAKGA